MIETIAAIARWLQLAANMTVLGSCVFLFIAGNIQNTVNNTWVQRIERTFIWMSFIIISGLLAILATTAAQVSGNIANLWQPESWLTIVTDSRVGHIWAGRAGLVLLLLGVIVYLRKTVHSRTNEHYLLCGIVASLLLIAGSLVSHTAAEDLSVLAVLPYALHIVLGGVWLGAMPAFLLMLSDYIKREHNLKINIADIQVFKRFSRFALPVMLLIVVTGIIAADRTFDDNYAALVATPYGWLLSAKLALLIIILFIAARVRSHWLPALEDFKDTVNAANGARSMRRWIRIEYILALLLLLLATILSNVTPAKYAPIEDWLFPFRFSIDATWNQDIAVQVWIGVSVFIVAFVMLIIGMTKKWNIWRQAGIPIFFLIVSAAVTLHPLSIEAYPETYRGTTIPFDAVSITNGAELYKQNCVNCHGPQGKGNGILSRTLSTKPIDLLTEPHTEEHTVGDFYHWLTYGVKDTEMPGYKDQLSEEDRWDLVNFLHALARGYKARILSPEIVPERPYVIPPGFYYAAYDGTSGLLQHFNEQQAVLIVNFTWPQSQARLEQLAQAHDRLSEQNTVILAVPTGGLDTKTIEKIADQYPFLIVTQGASEIALSYALSRRTLRNPDMMGGGTTPDHMEFLVDRYGYLRARWIPTDDEEGWRDINLLVQQTEKLKLEKQVLPLASEYVD